MPASIITIVALLAGWAIGQTTAPVTGRLYVKTEPPGASIVKAGQVLGTTPVLLHDVPVGRFEAVARLEGHIEQQVAVDIRPQVVNRVELELARAGLTIHVRSRPDAASIYIDGVLQTDDAGNAIVTPATITLERGGMASVAVAKLGYADAVRQNISLRPGLQLEFNLRRGESGLLKNEQPVGMALADFLARPNERPLELFRQARAIRPRPFSGTLEMWVSGLAEWPTAEQPWQSTGLKLRQGTPLNLTVIGGRWGRHPAEFPASDAADMPRLVARLGDIEIRLLRQPYVGVAPADGELLVRPEYAGPHGWGALQLQIQTQDGQQVAELAAIHSAYRPADPPITGLSLPRVRLELPADRLLTDSGLWVQRGQIYRVGLAGIVVLDGQSVDMSSRSDAMFVRIGDDPRDPFIMLVDGQFAAARTGPLYIGYKLANSAATGAIEVTLSGRLRQRTPTTQPAE